MENNSSVKGVHLKISPIKSLSRLKKLRETIVEAKAPDYVIPIMCSAELGPDDRKALTDTVLQNCIEGQLHEAVVKPLLKIFDRKPPASHTTADSKGLMGVFMSVLDMVNLGSFKLRAIEEPPMRLVEEDVRGIEEAIGKDFTLSHYLVDDSRILSFADEFSYLEFLHFNSSMQFGWINSKAKVSDGAKRFQNVGSLSNYVSCARFIERHDELVNLPFLQHSLESAFHHVDIALAEIAVGSIWLNLLRIKAMQEYLHGRDVDEALLEFLLNVPEVELFERKHFTMR